VTRDHQSNGERVAFPVASAPGIELEGRLLDGGGRAVVISHPHPLHGGDMDHPVVETVWRAAADAGYRALRYNFRGVGASTGELRPKSPLALEDLRAAIAFLDEKPLLAIGYSYGARATLHGIYGRYPFERAVLIGIPTRRPANTRAMSNLILGRRLKGEEYKRTPDLDMIEDTPVPVRLISGALDPLFESDEVRARGVEPVLIEGCNHFFSRKLGNQPPEPADLELVAEHALRFLETDSA